MAYEISGKPYPNRLATSAIIRTGEDALPKMCGARDGGAQALRDELAAFFGRVSSPVPPPDLAG